MIRRLNGLAKRSQSSRITSSIFMRPLWRRSPWPDMTPRRMRRCSATSRCPRRGRSRRSQHLEHTSPHRAAVQRASRRTSGRTTACAKQGCRRSEGARALFAVSPREADCPLFLRSLVCGIHDFWASPLVALIAENAWRLFRREQRARPARRILPRTEANHGLPNSGANIMRKALLSTVAAVTALTLLAAPASAQPRHFGSHGLGLAALAIGVIGAAVGAEIFSHERSEPECRTRAVTITTATVT